MPNKLNLKNISQNSGCYLFYDKKNTLLYIGKAKNLKKRVSSYFQKTKKSPKTQSLVKKISRIETRITNSENEALILENNLIKEFRPKFNVLLRDDKNFLYLKITNEKFPKLEITRRLSRDGAFYIGPKTSAKKFRNTINFCQKIFQVRTCKCKFEDEKEKICITKNPEKRKIPCLDFHIKKCSGPCAENISEKKYLEEIQSMKKFLRGDTSDVLKNLNEKMFAFADEKNFEAAAKMRDLINSIKDSTKKQNVEFPDLIDRDFINFFRTKDSAYFVRIIFRNGKFLDQNEIMFSTPEHIEDAELLKNFVIQFYEKVDILPQEIFLPTVPQDLDFLLDFLENIKNKNIQSNKKNKVQIFCPKKGDKLRILEMAQKNAKNFCDKNFLEKISYEQNFANALPELQKILFLKNKLSRIECFDISHFGGNATVGSQVVFFDGKPKKSQYRRFHIKNLAPGQIDDFAAMQEVLERRIKYFDLENKKIKKNNNQSKNDSDKKLDKNDKIKKIPDLIVIDGGKGQLSAVLKIFETYKLSKKIFDPTKQIIALAKREEEIFLPKKSDPLIIEKNSSALKLLQRIRDEAHRFAISFNRSVREKKMQKSVLDEIDGIGPVTKKKLIKKFGSIGEIKKASNESLSEILNENQVENLRKIL